MLDADGAEIVGTAGMLVMCVYLWCSAKRRVGILTSVRLPFIRLNPPLRAPPVKGAQTPDETGEPLAGFAPLNFTEEVR